MGRDLRVGRLLKRGGMADIFEAEEAQLGGIRRPVVVKRLRAEEQQELEAAFIEEARVLSQLNHPGVVRLLGLDEIDGALIQIFEAIDGLDLEGAIGEARARSIAMPLPVALHVAIELAHTLHFVHDARDSSGQPLGIVHRDVTPANVMLARSGDVRLIDFGLAFAFRRSEKTQAGVRKGTLGYMAPEQWRGELVDRRADVFAVGCLLIFALTGESLLATDAARRRFLADRTLPWPDGVPQGLRAILSRALAYDRRQRYESAEALELALTPILRAETSADGRALLADWLKKLKHPPSPSRQHVLEALFLPAEATNEPAPVRTSFLDPRDALTDLGEHERSLPTFDALAEPSTAPDEGPTVLAHGAREAVAVLQAQKTARPDAPVLPSPQTVRRVSPDPTPEPSLVVLVSSPPWWRFAGAVLLIALLVGFAVGLRSLPSADRETGRQPTRELPPAVVSKPAPSVITAIAPTSSVSRAPPLQVEPAAPRPKAPAALRRASSPTSPPTSPSISAIQVKAALDQLAQALRTQQSVLSTAELKTFETRYFDLRSRFAPSMSPEDARALAAAVVETQRSLERRLAEGLRPMGPE
ncbi:MAG: serine/threonine protein kinase [Deltaproteobacteria bacterium]|nr:serine/threonine protein kinase [Deltaproteobacteria bacterium]